jgi:hypothetical protein
MNMWPGMAPWNPALIRLLFMRETTIRSEMNMEDIDVSHLAPRMLHEV